MKAYDEIVGTAQNDISEERPNFTNARALRVKHNTSVK
jgi:hypothetical protein